MDLFKLVGSVFIDTDQANDSLQKTDEKAQKTGTSFKDIAGKAAKVGTAVVGASAAAVGGIVSLANNAASAADEIDKGSIRMGISTDYYQQLGYAAGQSGVEMGTLEKAAKKLEGTDLNLEDAMNQIMSLETAEDRAAKAAELFGDSVAYQMSPLIEQSGESFDDLIQRADDLGLVMGEDVVKAGVTMGDTMSDVQQSFNAIVTKLGGSLMPVVQEFLDLVLEFMPFIITAFEQLSPLLTMVFENLMPPLMELAQTLFPILMDFIQQLLPPIIELVSALLPVIVNLLDALSPILQPILDLLLALLPPLIEIINVIIVPLINLLSQGLKIALQVIGEVVKVVAQAFTAAWNGIKKAWDGAGKFFSNIWQGIKRTFSAVGTFFTNIFKGAWDGIKKIWDKVTGWFSSLWDGIKNVFKAGLNGVIGFLNTMIRGVNILLTPLRAIIAAVGKMFGASWTMEQVAIPEIPGLARGGQHPGTTLVGEDGPELVDLPSSATVIPLNRSSVSLGIEDLGTKMDQVITLMNAFITALQSMGVFLDGRVLVGQLAPGIDRELGRIAAREGRLV